MKDAECCAAGAMTCRKDATGTLRCLGPAASGGACASSGFACATPEQCCSLHCSPDGSGALGCRVTCAPAGAACNADEDCCGGACVGAPGQTACAADSIDGGPACVRAGELCDPLAAACCAGSVCALVAGDVHACAVSASD